VKHTIPWWILLCAIFLAFAACSNQSQTSSPLASVTHSSHIITHEEGSPTPTETSIATPTQVATSTPTQGVMPTPTAMPTSTGSQTPTSGKSISSTITDFYQAVEHKNYAHAYSYLSSDAETASGQKLTLDVFLQMAQVGDADGAVNSFAFIADSTDATKIIMSLTRGASLRYHAHLQMKEKDSTWQIFQLDIL